MEQIISSDFIEIKVPLELQAGCRTSEFQYLNHKTIYIDVSLEGGTEFPDFINADGYVPFISDKLRRLFEKMGIDNLFYKKVIFRIQDFDIEETYYLAVPPRIDCLDPECIDPYLGLALEIRLLPQKVGNYEIFRLAGTGNSDIIVTGKFRQWIQMEFKDHGLTGIHFTKIGEKEDTAI